jgi:Type II secretion system (T2SS), protein M subtype b
MTRLTQREQRLMAAGLLIVLVAIFLFLILLPLVSGFFTRADERAQMHGQWQRNERVISGISGWRRTAERQKRDAVLFAQAATSPAQARDLLRQQLAQRIAARGGALKQIQDGQSDEQRARLVAEFRIGLPQLTRLLRDLQGSAPIAIAEKLRINANRTVEDGRLQPLDVRLELAFDLAQAR